MPRVTLTKAELATPAGKHLVALITRIGSDGEITLAELSELESAVSEKGPWADLAAAAFLREIVHEIIADGRIDMLEAERLRRGLARVLPKGIRERFEDALPANPDASKPVWHHDPASDRQIHFLQKLGHPNPHSMSKGEASMMIDALLSAQESGFRHARQYTSDNTHAARSGPTDRQLMVLRFWGRKEPMTGTRQHVSDIIDSWYSAEPRMKIAWEAWKKAQDREITNPNDVPFGIGEEWLAKTKEQIARDIQSVLASMERAKTVRRIPSDEGQATNAPAGPLSTIAKWLGRLCRRA